MLLTLQLPAEHPPSKVILDLNHTDQRSNYKSTSLTTFQIQQAGGNFEVEDGWVTLRLTVQGLKTTDLTRLISAQDINKDSPLTVRINPPGEDGCFTVVINPDE